MMSMEGTLPKQQSPKSPKSEGANYSSQLKPLCMYLPAHVEEGTCGFFPNFIRTETILKLCNLPNVQR